MFNIQFGLLFSPLRHSREGGNPVYVGIDLDARLRGHDDLNSYQFGGIP